jgi:hypothetical protein
MDNQRLIELAIQGLEAHKARLETEIAELRRQLSGGRPQNTLQRSVARRSRKGITAAGRKRLSELMTARWAARRAQASKGRKTR